MTKTTHFPEVYQEWSSVVFPLSFPYDESIAGYCMAIVEIMTHFSPFSSLLISDLIDC